MTAKPDSWVECRCGRRHWGALGAAGLLAVADSRALLQLRAEGSHQGGTWGLPGGARRAGETAVDAALRETVEETTLDVSKVRIGSAYVLDHVDWSYTTVIGYLDGGTLPAIPANWESTALEWVPFAKVTGRTLLGSFARAWPELLALI